MNAYCTHVSGYCCKAETFYGLVSAPKEMPDGCFSIVHTSLPAVVNLYACFCAQSQTSPASLTLADISTIRRFIIRADDVVRLRGYCDNFLTVCVVV